MGVGTSSYASVCVALENACLCCVLTPGSTSPCWRQNKKNFNLCPHIRGFELILTPKRLRNHYYQIIVHKMYLCVCTHLTLFEAVLCILLSLISTKNSLQTKKYRSDTNICSTKAIVR